MVPATVTPNPELVDHQIISQKTLLSKKPAGDRSYVKNEKSSDECLSEKGVRRGWVGQSDSRTVGQSNSRTVGQWKSLPAAFLCDVRTVEASYAVQYKSVEDIETYHHKNKKYGYWHTYLKTITSIFSVF